MDHIIIF